MLMIINIIYRSYLKKKNASSSERSHELVTTEAPLTLNIIYFVFSSPFANRRCISRVFILITTLRIRHGRFNLLKTKKMGGPGVAVYLTTLPPSAILVFCFVNDGTLSTLLDSCYSMLLTGSNFFRPLQDSNKLNDGPVTEFLCFTQKK